MRNVCSLRWPWDFHSLQILFMHFLFYFAVAEGTLFKRIPVKTQNLPLNPCQKCIRFSFAGMDLEYLKMLVSHRKKTPNNQPSSLSWTVFLSLIPKLRRSYPEVAHLRPFLAGEFKERLPGNPSGIFQPWTIIIRALPSLKISLTLS